MGINWNKIRNILENIKAQYGKYLTYKFEELGILGIHLGILGTLLGTLLGILGIYLGIHLGI